MCEFLSNILGLNDNNDNPAPPPPPEAAPLPVNASSSEVKKNQADAAQQQSDKLKRFKGMRSTLLTGEQGLLGGATTQKKTLLGQ